MKQHFREAMTSLEDDHWWYRARRTILEHAVSRFVGEAGLGLTIGVGAVREAEMLSRHCRLVSIDIAPIDPRCADIGPATQATATALPFSDNAFDAVFLFDVLEHIEQDDVVLEEIRRVLKPDGKLLLTVPAFMFLYGLQDIVSEHKRRYRIGPFRDLLARSGFELEYSSYFNTLLFPPIAAVRLFRRVFPADASRGGSDFDLRLPRLFEGMLERLFSLERHAIDRAHFPFGISILCSARRPS